MNKVWKSSHLFILNVPALRWQIWPFPHRLTGNWIHLKATGMRTILPASIDKLRLLSRMKWGKRCVECGIWRCRFRHIKRTSMQTLASVCVHACVCASLIPPKKGLAVTGPKIGCFLIRAFPGHTSFSLLFLIAGFTFAICLEEKGGFFYVV